MTSRTLHTLSLGVLLLFVIFAAIAMGCRFRRPYGHREAFLRTVDSDLQNFASDHDGFFPSAADRYAALALLYPDYSDSGCELAGLSGNISAVTNALQSGKSISNLTSWMFVPGLRQSDDPRIAIIWEATPGLLPDGTPGGRGSRPALLLSRTVTNIAWQNWNAFTKQQEELLSSIYATRHIRSNVPIKRAP